MDKIIYIADDDDNIRNLLKSFLEREGYIIYGFPTGDDLLKRFITNPCDLIILDVMMPGRDGFFILTEIRKISNVPIIMLTARDSDADYIEGLNLGSDDYFTKPFSPIKLVTKVNSIFARLEASHSISVDVRLFALTIPQYPTTLWSFVLYRRSPPQSIIIPLISVQVLLVGFCMYL